MCGSVHVCEGEARLLCRGEADTSMVALCLLAKEAKGHETGINYIVKEMGERCVYVLWGLIFSVFKSIFLIYFTLVFHVSVQCSPAS